ncbi:hypothetical protein [Bacillus cereus]|uniref:hypothetical protein n=1 Tax=Bacillus cereus TaxID=1396 RepID=UPI00211D8791|nr:hypothetical protein [Bacillus cereus]
MVMSVVADVIMITIAVIITMIVEIGKVFGKSALKKSTFFCSGIFWSYLLRENRENQKES